MTLGDHRRAFARDVAKLLEFAFSQGYEITIGEVIRSGEQADEDAALGIGIRHSLHLVGLAVDLNLFRDGNYLPNTSDHAPLGTYWKSLNKLNFWGGDFSNPDGNHYSRSPDNGATK